MPRFHGRIQRAETTPSLLQPPAGASPHQFPSWNQSSSLLNLGGALRAIATRRAHFPRFIYLRVFWKGAGGGRERGTSASQGSSWERRPKNPTGTGSTPAAPLGVGGQMEGGRRTKGAPRTSSKLLNTGGLATSANPKTHPHRCFLVSHRPRPE